jgi:ribosome biogenesis GTPase A
MTAAKNNAEKAMEINDVIVEVLDARIPGSSVNPVIKIYGQEGKDLTLKS